MTQLLAPADLSGQLRTAVSPDLRRRRQIVGLSLVGTLIGCVVTAYQTGLTQRLPDILPGRLFDAEKVDASDYAYRHLQMPDAPQMIVTYGVTTALASAGGAERSAEYPALPVALAAKTGFDLATCLALAKQEWAENRAFCSWCQVATLISAVSFALSLPEARRALIGATA